MNIETTRFGQLEVKKEDVITFKDGILGFEEYKEFFVVDPGDNTLILWLQSTVSGSVAFPIIEPKIFKHDYSVKLLPAELTSLGLESLSSAVVYTILTIPNDVSKMSANLKAPVIINNKEKLARQIVLQDNKLSVNYEMYKDLKTYIVNYSSDDSKRTTVQVDDTNAVETAIKNPEADNENKAEVSPSD